MARPFKERCINFDPASTYFKPRGIPLPLLKIVELRRDELEAFRLCDGEDFDQQKAARRMKVSQSTVHRLLASARKKIADAVASGKAIRIAPRNVPTRD